MRVGASAEQLRLRTPRAKQIRDANERRLPTDFLARMRHLATQESH
jgi:hypothetical protein